jgi:hypothetical protein
MVTIPQTVLDSTAARGDKRPFNVALDPLPPLALQRSGRSRRSLNGQIGKERFWRAE